MLKAYSDARNRCSLHPHRQAEYKCDRCKTGLCRDCVKEYQGQTLCEHCMDELVLVEESKPTFTDRVHGFLRWLRTTAIVLVVVAIIFGGLFLVFHNLMDQPVTPEELARFRYAAAGSFETPNGVNVNSTVLGAKLVSYSTQRKGFEAFHVINEYAGKSYPGWRSAAATFPQYFIVEQQATSTIEKVVLTQQPDEPKSTWAKEVEVDASTTSATTGFKKIGVWTLQQKTGPQAFTFPAARTKFLRLQILSNYGSSRYTSLAEFDAFVNPPSATSRTPAASAPAATATP